MRISSHQQERATCVYCKSQFFCFNAFRTTQISKFKKALLPEKIEKVNTPFGGIFLYIKWRYSKISQVAPDGCLRS